MSHFCKIFESDYITFRWFVDYARVCIFYWPSLLTWRRQSVFPQTGPLPKRPLWTLFPTSGEGTAEVIMRIFGSIGRIGSGKDEVIKYLNRKYGYPSSLSGIS